MSKKSKYVALMPIWCETRFGSTIKAVRIVSMASTKKHLKDILRNYVELNSESKYVRSCRIGFGYNKIAIVTTDEAPELIIGLLMGTHHEMDVATFKGYINYLSSYLSRNEVAISCCGDNITLKRINEAMRYKNYRPYACFEDFFRAGEAFRGW